MPDLTTIEAKKLSILVEILNVAKPRQKGTIFAGNRLATLMIRLKAGSIIGSVFKKIAYPPHLWRIIKLECKKKQPGRVYDDPQLKLYSRILPGDFLHYGYFDDGETAPQCISLNDIYRAQLRYAKLILEQVENCDAPVLDVGCGMGGLIRLLNERGLRPVALSPDKNQIEYVKRKYPQTPVIESKFEDISAEENSSAFGTVIMSESLQYLDWKVTLPLVEKILRPRGRWIVSDYFRTGEAGEKSGHRWKDFEEQVTSSGWKFIHRQDITANILPTLKYIYLWGRDIAHPMLNFAIEKLHRKQPGLHYLLEESIKTLNGKIDRNLEIINPETFAANKKYMLLVLAKIK